jgi:aryl-alcohol dehydrogenase-like predicted oxidoreductase
MGVFDAFQIPYSALEPEHGEAISDAASAGSGTIIRGGVARGAPEKPADAFAAYPERMRGALEARRDRWSAADLDGVLDGMSRMEFMLRYTLSHPDMHTTIVGTANLEHLAANVTAAAKGPLPPDVLAAARQRLAAA